MIRSGLKVPTPAIPMPDLAVPYAAPSAVRMSGRCCHVLNAKDDSTYIRISSLHQMLVSVLVPRRTVTYCESNTSLPMSLVVAIGHDRVTYHAKERRKRRGIVAVRICHCRRHSLKDGSSISGRVASDVIGMRFYNTGKPTSTDSIQGGDEVKFCLREVETAPRWYVTSCLRATSAF
jgi:hypothetical protein